MGFKRHYSMHGKQPIIRIMSQTNVYQSDQGEGLSGGEIQRVALARAFLKDAPFVILDEATANLDTENEKSIQQAIDKLAHNRTLLVIAHRLKTIEQADNIVVMDKGRVIETGTHQQLIKQQGAYQALLETLKNNEDLMQ